MGWLSALEQLQYKKYGFYSKNLTLKNGRTYDKTRIIAINTMSCLSYNFNLLQARYDPGDQLDWLQKELASLDAVGGRAIIIGHVPPLFSECNHGWSVRYQALVERYQNVIKFGLFGHDHKEQIQLITSPKNNQKRIGLQFMGGSATTFWKNNPSFTVINVDDQLLLATNFETHFFNITKAAQNPKNASWERLHDYKIDFNLLDMSPDEVFRGLAQRVLNEEKVAQIYYWNKFRRAEGMQAKSCSYFCRLQLFCEIAHPEQFEYNNCMGQPNYDFVNEPHEAFMNLLTAEWVKRLTPYS